jgi:hypothetical protein
MMLIGDRSSLWNLFPDRSSAFLDYFRPIVFISALVDTVRRHAGLGTMELATGVMQPNPRNHHSDTR